MRFVPLLALLVALASQPAISDTAIRPADGPIVLARSGATAIYLWDASPYVASLLKEGVTSDAGMRALEATAVSILADKASTNADARTLSIRVVYQKTGAVSPAYGTATFNGIEKVMTVSLMRDDAVRSGKQFASDVAAGNVPSQVHIDVTGVLPSK